MVELLEKMLQTLHQHRQEHLRKTVSPGTSPSISEEPVASQMKAPQQLVQLKQAQIKLSLQILYAIAKNGPKRQRNPSRLVNGGSGCDQLSPT